MPSRSVRTIGCMIFLSGLLFFEGTTSHPYAALSTLRSYASQRTTKSPVSRPVQLHHRPLAEPSMRLSPHSAPIRQTCRSYRSYRYRRACLSHASRSSCCQLLRSYDCLTRPLRSSPITSFLRYCESVRPSAPHRYAGLAVFAAWASPLAIRATYVFRCDRGPYSFSNLPKKER